jgi:hypothetical protein
MLVSGELRHRVIQEGLRGMTSNPQTFAKAIATADYDAQIESIIMGSKSCADVEAIYEALVITDIRNACDTLRPIYDDTSGVDGYVSLKVSPRLGFRGLLNSLAFASLNVSQRLKECPIRQDDKADHESLPVVGRMGWRIFRNPRGLWFGKIRSINLAHHRGRSGFETGLAGPSPCARGGFQEHGATSLGRRSLRSQGPPDHPQPDP